MQRLNKGRHGTMTAKELGELLIKFGGRKVYVIEDELEDKICPISKASVTINKDGVYFCPDRVIGWQSKYNQVYHIGEVKGEL